MAEPRRAQKRQHGRSAQALLRVNGPGALIWPVLGTESAAPVELEGHWLVGDPLLQAGHGLALEAEGNGDWWTGLLGCSV